jgi:nitrogen-specific signal transduction histidine kinase
MAQTLTPLEQQLARQLEKLTAEQAGRIRDLEDRVAELEKERKAMRRMLDFFDTLNRPQSSFGG